MGCEAEEMEEEVEVEEEAFWMTPPVKEVIMGGCEGGAGGDG